MSSEEVAVHVNFGKPMPLFPLDRVTLLPQQVLPLHIFEPRYRMMVAHALDGAGQIAMAVFKHENWKEHYHGRPALRPAVCVGQIVQHEKLPDGRFNLLLQGVCRARIVKEMPASTERLYREAMLEPIGLEEPESEAMAKARERLNGLLSEGPLSRLTAAKPIVEYVRNHEIPTPALLELISFTIVNDPELRYRLLEEGDTAERTRLIFNELGDIERLIRMAARQKPEDWPKGMSWN